MKTQTRGRDDYSTTDFVGNSFTVLFIPFDATKGHATRNANNGVMAVQTTEIAPGISEESRTAYQATSPGVFMGNPGINKNLTQIVESCCNEINKEREYRPLRIVKRPTHEEHVQAVQNLLLKRANGSCPMLVFLSEQPKGVNFPANFTLSNGVRYVLQDTSAGSRAVQIIKAYVRKDLLDSLYGPQWHVQGLVKKRNDNKQENILCVTYTINGSSMSVAGLHLSAQNTSATIAARESESQDLSKFGTQHKIDFVIGDMNMNIMDFAGNVGATTGSTVFVNANGPGNLLVSEQQYSSSNNKSHYMGMKPMHDGVRFTGGGAQGHFGLSLGRHLEIDGIREYYSDHPALYASLEFR